MFQRLFSCLPPSYSAVQVSSRRAAATTILLLNQVWHPRPTITYGLVACFVTESKNESD